MHYDFTYKIISIQPDGLALIEYSCKELGSIRRQVYLPIEEGDNAILQTIMYTLPRAHFRSILRKNNKEAQEKIKELLGKTQSFEANIEDNGHYDYLWRTQ